MTHRSDRVRLHPAESRCEPSGPCSMRNRCARYQAVIPTGTPLEDFTTGDLYRVANGGTATCPGFLGLADRHTEAKPSRPVKPAIRGIS